MPRRRPFSRSHADVQGGDRRAALAELDIYARMGQAADVVDTLPEFEPLRRATAYQPIAAALAMNRLPVDAASPAFALAGTPWLPEDIDYEPHARRFFFTSIVPGTIVSTAGDGSISEFARAPDGWSTRATPDAASTSRSANPGDMLDAREGNAATSAAKRSTGMPRTFMTRMHASASPVGRG